MLSNLHQLYEGVALLLLYFRRILYKGVEYVRSLEHACKQGVVYWCTNVLEVFKVFGFGNPMLSMCFW